MGALDYHFGTGRGPVHRHVSAADAALGGDGVPDAVRLDFDGDGRADDALWDRDRDGRADTALLDLDDDGRAERAFADPSGRGVWDEPASGPARRPDRPGGEPTADPVGFSWTDVRGRAGTALPALDSDGDGADDAAPVDADHDPATAEAVCDLDGDGRADQLLLDRDRDGAYEAAYLSSSGASAPAGRWDVLLTDSDGDGAVDTTAAEDGPGWLAP